NISVYSPSGRAAKFATKHGLRAVAAETVPSAVAHADLVITCTTSENHVVSAATFAAGRTAAEATAPATAGCPVDHTG
ncbi:hypothetical protein, partial [Enterococcus faecium]|uniref:hypothetical protein n=1 Tax=Enterococcus faecium TaxID=1352 RepID=UPI003F43A99C